MRVLAVTAILSSWAIPAMGQASGAGDFVTVKVATVGVGLMTRAPVVVLHDPVSDKTMPVWVGEAEAQAIARALFDMKMPRPMTHDLLALVIRSLDATVEEIRVTDTRDGVYFGRIYLRTRDKKVVDIDSRPSDAVALALRTGSPIRVHRKLLDEAPEIAVTPDENTPDFARALGLTVVSPNEDIRKMFQLPKREGVVVLDVTGEAEEVGLKRGDLILQVDGKTPKGAQAFWDAVRQSKTGSVTLRYWRGDKETEVRVTPRRPQGRPGSGAVPA